MQMTTLAADLKLGAAAAIIGAIAAGAISFTMPRRYVSTAVMRIVPRAVGDKPAWQIEAEAAHRLREMQGEILGRSSLTEIIQRPTMDLYRQERAIYPMEDAIQDMRTRDVHIQSLPARAFRMSFEYPDRVKAQAVVRELTARSSGYAEILTPASFPEKPSQPDRLAIMGIGLGVGLAMGILLAFLRRRPLKWTLRMAGCTVAGCVFAAAICLLMPDTFADDQKSYQFAALGAFTGLALGAFLLRARGTGRNHYARLIACSAACGAIAGGLVSFALPERYVSTAAMRAFPFSGGGAGAGQLEVEPAARLRQLTEDILSRGSLSELVQRPSLDLYRIERSRRPMEDIVNDMRHRDIRIKPAPNAGLTGLGSVTNFQISFEYTDRYKAQAVVRELVTKFTEGNVRADRDLALVGANRDLPRGQMAGSLPFNVAAERKPDRDKVPGSLVLEVVDPASLPARPVSPNRPAVAAIGLLAGMLLGSLLALRRWLAARQAATPGPHPSYWKYTFAAAAIGAIAFGLGSFVIPNRYVSTAVLRVVPFPAGGARTAQGEIEYTARLRQLTQDILSRGSLAELICRPSLDLYRPERQRYPLEDVINDMRNRYIRIAPTPPFGLAGPGHLTSFEISFEYPDRETAQDVVRELVAKFTDGNAAAEHALHRDRMPGSLVLEVVDPASLPGNPVSPNRPAAAAIGLLAGMLLGPFLAWRRQQRANRQAAGLGLRPSYWKYALPAAILGAILGAILASYASFYIPNRYVSTAVLRLVSADPRAAKNAQAAAERMPEMFQQVLSRDSLAEIILRPSLQLYAPELYAPERKRRSQDEVVKQMRERDLRVEPLRDSPFGGRPTAFRISFEYSNPAKALACVQAVVSKFVEAALPPQKNEARRHAPSDGHGRLLFFTTDPFANPVATLHGFRRRDAADLLDDQLVEGGGDTQGKPDAPYLEVLDPADVHQTADNFLRWFAAGGLAGLLLGIAIARARRSAPHPAAA